MTRASMISNRLTFVDTSILDEILEVPGWSQDVKQVRSNFGRMVDSGARLLLPVSAIIETGNHIAQCQGDRRGAARRYQVLLSQLLENRAPWRTNAVVWNDELLRQYAQGAHTGVSLVDLLHAKAAGGGDLAILVEAGRLSASTFGMSIDLWSKDNRLRALWPFGSALD